MEFLNLSPWWWEKRSSYHTGHQAVSRAMFHSDVTLRHPLHIGDKTQLRELHACFETQGRQHWKSKTRILVAPKKG